LVGKTGQSNRKSTRGQIADKRRLIFIGSSFEVFLFVRLYCVVCVFYEHEFRRRNNYTHVSVSMLRISDRAYIVENVPHEAYQAVRIDDEALYYAVHTASTRSVLKQPYLNNIEATENW
jgi:hypothetical protein